MGVWSIIVCVMVPGGSLMHSYCVVREGPLDRIVVGSQTGGVGRRSWTQTSSVWYSSLTLLRLYISEFKHVAHWALLKLRGGMGATSLAPLVSGGTGSRGGA